MRLILNVYWYAGYILFVKKNYDISIHLFACVFNR